MKWTPGGTSRDLEDQRGRSGGGFRGAQMGLGGTLLLLLLSAFFGRDLSTLFSGSPASPLAVNPGSLPVSQDPQEEQLVQFVSFVLDDAQQTWETILPRQGTPYRRAKLVLFRDATDSACGTARSSIGPFYCPLDERVYIDLAFYHELKSRFGAPGEFAQAYVLAHEIGHHVQKLLTIEPRIHALQEQSPSLANQLSVRMELQADCFAGIWAYSTAQRQIIEQTDVESGLQAAAAIGDDRLQRGHVSPESFTHGTSAQRVRWFQRGLTSGQVQNCDTFGGR